MNGIYKFEPPGKRREIVNPAAVIKRLPWVKGAALPVGSRATRLGRSKVQPWPNDVSCATHCIGLYPVALRLGQGRLRRKSKATY